MEYNQNQISKGVSPQRVQEYLSGTRPEQPLKLRKIAIWSLTGALGVSFLLGVILLLSSPVFSSGNNRGNRADNAFTDAAPQTNQEHNQAIIEKATIYNQNPEVSQSANPASQFEYEIFNMNSNDSYKAVRIKRYIGTDLEVEIPNVIEGYQVTEICEGAFKDQKYLTKVILPNGLLTISSGAFEGCASLTEIQIPSTVTSIMDWAFGGCTSLVTVEKAPAPDNYEYYGLWKLGRGAFDGCASLQSVKLPGNTFPEPEFGENVFSNCSSLTEVALPDYIYTIPKQTFKNCSALTDIGFVGDIHTIGEEAFCGCTGLTAVNLPGTIRMVGASAFSDCSNLRELTFGAYITNSDAATEAGVSETAVISHYAFRGTVIESVTIPGYVTQLCDRCLASPSLHTVVWQDNEKGIADQIVGHSFGNPFQDCPALTDVYLPATIREVHINFAEQNFTLHAPEGSMVYSMAVDQGVTPVNWEY